MEDIDKAEQVQLLSKATILLGVHGTGLSGQLWLNPSPRTTVIEIYYPGGFLYDYEYTARSLGHKHYGVWNDKLARPCCLPELFSPVISIDTLQRLTYLVVCSESLSLSDSYPVRSSCTRGLSGVKHPSERDYRRILDLPSFDSGGSF